MPVASSASSSSSWRPGQPQVGGVAALTGRAAAEQPGPVAEHHHADVGLGRGAPPPPRSRRRRRRAPGSPRASVTLVARRVAAARRARSATVDAQRHVRVVHADMQRERVAAQHRVRVVGARARRPRPAGRAPQRQRAVVGEQHDRAPRELARQRARLPRRRGRRAPPSAAGSGDQLGVEQAELALLPQHALERPVDQRHVDLRRLDGLEPAARRSSRPSAARRRCPPSAPAPPPRPARAGDAVQRLQEGDREVVGDDRAGEPVRRRAAASVSSAGSAATGTPSMSV